jgi:hypothetical protein
MPEPRSTSTGDLDPELAQELAAWLDEHWDPDLSVHDWWRLVGPAGWTAPHFPVEWGGRGCSPRAAKAVRAAFARHGALPAPGGLGPLMAAPTIASHGTPEQIERLVPRIHDGSAGWCQLFSEPGSGSDLAGLTTRAERDGDQWVISGQKVWSSGAHEADMGMLLARTDPDQPKHGGISWFAFRMDQPGVEVRPLREITGRALFNEVFLDGAVVDDADVVGGLNNGWAVAQSTLLFERTGIGAGGTMAGYPPPGPKGGFLDRRAGDAAALPPPELEQKPMMSLPELLDLARRTGRADDPNLRQGLAELYTWARVGEWKARRAMQPNLAKLSQTEVVKRTAVLIGQVLGPDAMLWQPDGPDGGMLTEPIVFSVGSSIYGGTDQIQRNVVAERVLGLPREPDPYKGRPFREVQAAIGHEVGA